MIINKKQIRTSVKPVTEPVTVAEAKTYLKIDGFDEDTLLSSFITPARIVCENFLNRSLLTQTKILSFDYFEGKDIRLPYPPIQSITSLTTHDKNNTPTVYDSSNYLLSNEMLIVNDNSNLPTELRKHYAIDIEYVAGYGDNASDVPEAIKQGIIFQIAHYYEAQCCTNKLSPEAEGVLQPYRIYSRGL